MIRKRTLGHVRTKRTSTSGNGYAFRPAKPSGVLNNSVKAWNIYPNPTATELTVENPIADEARYKITDMPGRTLLVGTLQAGLHTIDVSALNPGGYIVSMYKGDKKDYAKVFVKQ